ncbi:MAG: hypothetical protein ACREHG_10615, partial [Candidatus Saccharimonadales bacterium]
CKRYLLPMQPTHPRNNIFLIAALFAIGAAALLVLVVWLSAQIISGAAGIVHGRQQLTDATRQGKELAAFYQNQSSYQSTVDALHAGFVDVKNPVGVIQFLEHTASALNLGIVISIVQTDVAASSSAAGEPLTMAVNVQGNFLDTLAFVQQVEYGPYFITVQKFSAVKISTQSDNQSQSDNQPQTPAGDVHTSLLVQAITQ